MNKVTAILCVSDEIPAGGAVCTWILLKISK